MRDRPPPPAGGMHRLVVEALGDAQALAEVGPDGYLAPPAWAAALERVRAARHGSLPLAEGNHRVGRELAEAFLASPAGQLIAVTLPQLDLTRAFDSVLSPMAERLRRAFEYDFLADPQGGTLLIGGARVAAVETLQGFFEGLLARVPGHYAVSPGLATPTRLELHVTRLPEP